MRACVCVRERVCGCVVVRAIHRETAQRVRAREDGVNVKSHLNSE